MTAAVPASPRAGWFRAALALLLGGLMVLVLLPARAEIPVPTLTARVTDQTGTLDEGRRQALEAKLAAFEARKGSQIAVLLIPTTQPETIEQFGIRVAEAWKLGRKGVDDGVLLLVAKDDRALRIEVGYGLEGAIPDAVAKRVIEEVMVPRLKAGDLPGALDTGVDALIDLILGEPLPAPAPRGAGPQGRAWIENLFGLALLSVFFAGDVLRMLLGRIVGGGVAGVLTFVGAWWLSGSMLVALIFAVFALLMTLLGSARGGIYRGGGGGGSGGGWGGGGGFGGGGGGFGGGGASGRW